MMIQVKAVHKFLKLAKKVMTEEALQDLIDELTSFPESGDVIPKFPSLRKIRFKTGKNNKGKRGGGRAIYYYDDKHLVLLLVLYTKAEKSDLTDKELKELNKLLPELLRGQHND